MWYTSVRRDIDAEIDVDIDVARNVDADIALAMGLFGFI